MDAFLDVGFNQRSVENFHAEIYKLKGGGLTIMEAISEYCTQRTLDPEDIVKLIDPAMMSDLAREASDKKMLKPEARIKELDL